MNKKSLIQQWLCPIIIALVSAALYLFQQSALPLLEFSRDAINQGQWWRLLSGNIMHTNHWHLLLNIAGLFMLSHLFGRLFSLRHFIVFSTFNASLVGIMLYYYSTDIDYYVGLSGYLHGLFVYGCLIEIKHGMKSSWLLLGAVIAKIGYETLYGASTDMSELINASVATDAHLFGAIIAVPQFLLLMGIQPLIKNKAISD